MSEQMDRGFIRDAFGRLVVSGALSVAALAAGESLEAGFIRDAQKRLVVVGPEGTPLASKADLEPAWIKIASFTNSWVAETGYFKPSYRKIGDLVELYGQVKGGTSNQAAFTLPVGYRPAKIIKLGAYNCGVVVNTDGTVVPDSSTTVYLNELQFTTQAEPA